MALFQFFFLLREFPFFPPCPNRETSLFPCSTFTDFWDSLSNLPYLFSLKYPLSGWLCTQRDDKWFYCLISYRVVLIRCKYPALSWDFLRCVSRSASLGYDSLSLDEGITRVSEESAYALRGRWVRLDDVLYTVVGMQDRLWFVHRGGSFCCVVCRVRANGLERHGRLKDQIAGILVFIQAANIFILVFGLIFSSNDFQAWPVPSQLCWAEITHCIWLYLQHVKILCFSLKGPGVLWAGCRTIESKWKTNCKETSL